jgi:predicted amidophosphoribosyltransferase
LLARGLFAALFPSDCRICDAPLLNISRLPVCDECIAAIRPISSETCDICREALPGLARAGEMQTCSACQQTRPYFSRATAFGAYDGELRELIHLLKSASLIAHAALKKLAQGDLEFAAIVLVRVKPTVSQIGLTRPQRRENMRGAFQVVHPNRVKGRSILLVDDVLTTGTTASECARVLRKAGAEQVWVATAARTLKINDSNLRTEYDLETQAS